VDTNPESAQELLVRAVHLAALYHLRRFPVRCYPASNSTDCAANSHPGHRVSTPVCCLSSVWLLWCPRGQCIISLLLLRYFYIQTLIVMFLITLA